MEPHAVGQCQLMGSMAARTLQAIPTDLGGAVAGSAQVSNLCLSCHDGTIAVHSLYNDPNEVASVTISAGGNVLASGLMSGDPQRRN